MTSTPDPTARFSDRVADYVKHRPGYPDALATTLQRELKLSSGSTVADVGAGTGISTDLLIRLGCEVFAVEPNVDMRRAAEERFAGNAQFHSVAGRAEATLLPDASVDAVTAGQAFHWFDRVEARREFLRILRPGPGAKVALFWNTRRVDGTPFLVAYEKLLIEFGTDYQQVNHRNVDPAALREFFGGPFEQRVFDHEQLFDFDGLRGRLLSSSYVPGPSDPRHAPMLAALRRIFDQHQQDGRVHFGYDTELFVGALHGRAEGVD